MKLRQFDSQANRDEPDAGRQKGETVVKARSDAGASAESGGANDTRRYSVRFAAGESAAQTDECLVLASDCREAETIVKHLPGVQRVLDSHLISPDCRRRRYPDARFIDGQFIALDAIKKTKTPPTGK